MEAEDELAEEVAKDMRQLEPAPHAEESIKSRMNRAVGIDSVQYDASVMPYAGEPVIIEAEFTELKQSAR